MGYQQQLKEKHDGIQRKKFRAKNNNGARRTKST